MEHTLERAPLLFPIGTIINGPEQVVYWEFTRSPHLLIAGCCFSKRMRKLFRKNEKSVLRFCNKSSKTKRAFTKVLMPCKRPF